VISKRRNGSLFGMPGFHLKILRFRFKTIYLRIRMFFFHRKMLRFHNEMVRFHAQARDCSFFVVSTPQQTTTCSSIVVSAMAKPASSRECHPDAIQSLTHV
jgi:hypothetical protein